MSLSLALLMIASAAPVKVVAPAWQFTGLERAQGEVFEGRFLTLLGQKNGIEVITSRDMEAVLGLERQRSLLGCTTDSSACMAELSSALGADVVLTGSLAKTEKSFVVTLRGVNASNGKAITTATERLHGEDALFVWLEREANSFADRVRGSFEALVEARAVHSRYATWPWFVIGGGLVAFASGATLFGLSRVDLDAIRMNPPPAGDQLITGGQFKQDFGVGLAIGGLVAIAAGVGLRFLTREPEVTVAFVPTAGGGSLSLGGRW